MYDPEPPPRQHGCFFYGCIIAIILFVLVVAIAFMGGWYLYRRVVSEVLPYTSESPVALPKVELTEAQRELIRKRYSDFKEAVEADKAVEPLILTADDINALITNDPDFNGHVFVTIENDKVKGEVSIPLDAIGLPAFRGRYLNGSAEFKVGLLNGVLVVTADTIEVKGKPLPKKVMSAFQGKNLAGDAAKNPENAKVLGKLESIEVKDGKFIVKALTKREADAEKPKGKETGAAENPEAVKDQGEGKPAAPPALEAPERKADESAAPKAAA